MGKLALFGALTAGGQGFFCPVILHLDAGVSSSTIYTDLKGPEDEIPSGQGILWLLDVCERDRFTWVQGDKSHLQMGSKLLSLHYSHQRKEVNSITDFRRIESCCCFKEGDGLGLPWWSSG